MTDTPEPDLSASSTAAPHGGPAAPPPPFDEPAPAPLGDGRPRARASRPALLFLVLLSAALYLPSLNYQLVYDDWFLIAQNDLVSAVQDDVSNAFALFGEEYWAGVRTDMPEALRAKGQALYRPLTLFIWACLYSVQPVDFTHGAGDAWLYHLVSIALNTLVVVLAYLLALRLFGSGRVAFLGAFLFALHPLHVEAVAYVAGLSDLISALTIVGGLLLYLRATREPGRIAWGSFLAMLALLFVGLLAKEAAVLLIAAVALLDFVAWRAGTPLRTPKAVVYGGLLATLAAHIGVRWAALGYLRPVGQFIAKIDNPLVQEDFAVRLYTGLKVMAMEAWLLLWPQAQSIDYSFNAIPVSRSFGQAEVLAGAVLFGTLLVWSFAKMRRHPALAFSLLLFFGTMLFTANILQPLGTIFGERLTYVPSLGALLAIALVIDALVARLGGAAAFPAWASALVVVVGAGLGYQTITRSSVFRDKLELWESAREVVPESARVHFQLGAVYGSRQLYSAAEDSYKRALEIDPTFINAAIALGNVYAADRNFAKAIRVYDDILRQVENTPGEQSQLIQRMVYLRRGNAKQGAGDIDGSIYDLERAAALYTGDERTSNDASRHLAQVLIDRGRVADALETLRSHIAEFPDDSGALFMMARAASQIGDEEAYQTALEGLKETEDGRPQALAMEAEVLYEQSLVANDATMRQRALAMFNEATELDPDLATPYIYRGRYQAESRRFFDAILEFDLALEKHPNNPVALYFKALAQIAAGRYEEALGTTLALERVRPSVPCYSVMAEAYFHLGEPDKMEEAYEKVRELGEEPAELTANRVIALKSEGRVDEAIALLEQSFVLPRYANDPRLLRSYGVLLLDTGRFTEALAAFERQEAAHVEQPELPPDVTLALNRARALLAMDRDAEAATQLDLFEAEILAGPAEYQRYLVDLLRWRAELGLTPGSAFEDPEQALALALEGIEKSSRRYPRMFDLAIEASLASGDLERAAELAAEAVESFGADFPAYAIVSEALALAAAGDAAGAAAKLDESNALLAERLSERM